MKSVLVTGGTTRIGKAIAERLRADGWRVLTSSHRVDAGADIVANLAEPMGPARLYAAVMELLDGQPPDALVNNAALYVGEDAEIEAIDFIAPKKLTMLMAGRETAGRGSVVNILDTRVLNTVPRCVPARTAERSETAAGRVGQTSVPRCVPARGVGQTSVTTPRPGTARGTESAYTRAKTALLAYTCDSAETFAETLRVNAVAPGPVLAPTQIHEKAGELLVDRPTVDDVAAAVAYLLSARATTGCVIPVDGGQSLLAREDAE